MTAVIAAPELVPYRPKIARVLAAHAHPQVTAWVRPDTSDAKAVDEVWTRNAYVRHGIALRRSDRWLDAGSNVGAFADLAARAGAAVVAYEVEPVNAAIAARNLHRHARRAQVVQAALVADRLAAEGRGQIMLHLNSAPLALRRHSVVKARRASRPVPVPAHGITEVMDAGRYDGAKLNIEGAEIEVLLSWTPPQHLRYLVAEWSFDCDPSTATLRAALDVLARRYGSNVRLGRKVDFTRADFPWFPPQVYVYAWDPR